MIKIMADTSTLYTIEEGNKIGVDIIPLCVTINNKSYRELEEIDSATFLNIIREGHHPTSSQPSIGETVEAFEKNAENDVIYITMADGLSGTYQSACGAKTMLADASNIHVVNSETLCGPHRYLVQKAVRLVEEGFSVPEILASLQESIHTEISFIIPRDFGYLKRGGRLTPFAATLGSILGFVPILTRTKDKLRIEKYAIKRTYKSALRALVQALNEHKVDSYYIIYISHAEVEDLALKAKECFEIAFPDVPIEILELGPAFITQGGPGSIAIQAIRTS